jgi:hypothetical protein
MDAEQLGRLEVACSVHPDAVARIVAGVGTADDERVTGFAGKALMDACRASDRAWRLARSVLDLDHARGNPLPARACSRLGLPPIH